MVADAEAGEDDDERTPLLSGRTGRQYYRDLWKEFFNPYEPIDEGIEESAEHPSALLLLGMHLGMAALQICSVMGAYAQLVTNADLIFPDCSRHTILYDLLGLGTKTGYLCQMSSQCLWTFPLLCCIMIPVFEYWDFCHSRLYYECLRVRMLLIFPDKDLLQSPVFYILLFLLFCGIATAAFTTHDMDHFFWAAVPPLFPVFQFMTTMYITWDIKYYLIALPNLLKNVGWSKQFFQQCIDVTEGQLEQAYRRKCFLGWDGSTSKEIFLELRYQAVHVISREVSWTEEQAKNSSKTVALLFGGRGWWVGDLLWIPTDRRSSHFRFVFRLFAAVCSIIMVILAFVFLSTCLTYHVMRGKLTCRDIYPACFLQDFMIAHGHRLK